MNRLSELRSEKNLKQSDLAKLIGTTQQTISSYEREVYTQKDSSLEERIANFFECSIDYLRGLSDIRNSKKLIEDSILLKDEFIRLGIISEDEDISKDLLNYFRTLIALNKPFLSRFSKHKKINETDNQKINETDINSDKSKH